MWNSKDGGVDSSICPSCSLHCWFSENGQWPLCLNCAGKRGIHIWRRGQYLPILLALLLAFPQLAVTNNKWYFAANLECHLCHSSMPVRVLQEKYTTAEVNFNNSRRKYVHIYMCLRKEVQLRMHVQTHGFLSKRRKEAAPESVVEPSVLDVRPSHDISFLICYIYIFLFICWYYVN